MKVLDKKLYIQKCNEIHNYKYDYSKSEYTCNRNHIIIICPVHGEFKQIAASHKNGQGCPKCGFLRVKLSNTLKTLEFIDLCKTIHGNKYNYEKVNYVNNKTNVLIICKEHGEFWQNPNNHSKKKNATGCPKCNNYKKIKFKTKNDFLKEATKIHGNKYDYSTVNFVQNMNEKISFKCNSCFKLINQTISSHISRKQGCSHCNNYMMNNFCKKDWIKKGKDKEGLLYIVEMSNFNECFYKVGITLHSVKSRYKYEKIDYKIAIIHEIKSFNLNYIWELERKLIALTENIRYYPAIYFAGSKKECFKPKINIYEFIKKNKRLFYSK